MNTLAAGTAPHRPVSAFLTRRRGIRPLGPRSGTALFETARPTFQPLAFREESGFFPRRDRRFESLFLQRGVRCELDLGEGGFADEIAAAPPWGLYLLEDTSGPLEDWPPSLWPNHRPAGIGNRRRLFVPILRPWRQRHPFARRGPSLAPQPHRIWRMSVNRVVCGRAREQKTKLCQHDSRRPLRLSCRDEIRTRKTVAQKCLEPLGYKFHSCCNLRHCRSDACHTNTTPQPPMAPRRSSEPPRYVTRMPGGVGGVAPRGVPYPDQSGLPRSPWT
jgi:hypothetical protein